MSRGIWGMGLAARANVECHANAQAQLQSRKVAQKLIRGGKKEIQKYRERASVRERCTEALPQPPVGQTIVSCGLQWMKRTLNPGCIQCTRGKWARSARQRSE